MSAEMMTGQGADGVSSSPEMQVPLWKRDWMLIVPTILTLLFSILFICGTPSYEAIIEDDSARPYKVLADPAPVCLAPLPWFALSVAACASAIWFVLHFTFLVEGEGFKKSAFFIRFLGVTFIVIVFFCGHFFLLLVGPSADLDVSAWFGGEVVYRWGLLANRSEIVFESNGLWMTPIQASQY